jgi:hypothetical protein
MAPFSSGHSTQRLLKTELYGTYSDGVAMTAVANATRRGAMNFMVMALRLLEAWLEWLGNLAEE